VNFSNAARQLSNLQRDLYQRAYSEAQSYITIHEKTLDRYGAEFYRGLPGEFNVTTQNKFIDRVLQSQITLYGDFHTLRQSQRGFLRVLRNLHQTDPNKNVVVALEMFNETDQAAVDAYLDGEIDQDQLLKKISYEENWGFPFKNYEPILEAAKSFGYKIIGVNSLRKKRGHSITSRDQFIANRLTTAMNDYPDHLVVCLVGEFHIADLHLPRQLKRLSKQGENLKICKIATNVDSYYFDLPVSKVSGHTQYLELGSNFFCIMNTSPWIKWQSMVNWEVLKQVGCSLQDESIDDIDEFNEDGLDVEYQIIYLAKELGKFVGMKTENLPLDNIYSYFLYDNDEPIDVKIDQETCPYDLSGIINWVQSNGFYYYSPTSDVILNKLSLNHLSRISGQHLQTVASTIDIQAPYDDVTKFYLEVLKVAAGAFAARSLNPRRKALGLSDYINFIQRTNRKRLIGPARIHRENSRHLLKHHELVSNDEGITTLSLRRLSSLVKFDHAHSGMLALSIGSLLGLELSDKVVGSKISLDDIKDIFSYQISRKNELIDLFLRLYRFTL